MFENIFIKYKNKADFTEAIDYLIFNNKLIDKTEDDDGEWFSILDIITFFMLNDQSKVSTKEEGYEVRRMCHAYIHGKVMNDFFKLGGTYLHKDNITKLFDSMPDKHKGAILAVHTAIKGKTRDDFEFKDQSSSDPLGSMFPVIVEAVLKS